MVTAKKPALVRGRGLNLVSSDLLGLPHVLSCPGLSGVLQLLGLQVAQTCLVFPDLGTLKRARQAFCRPFIRLALSGF